MRQVTSTRAAHGGGRQDLDAGDAGAGMIPDRPAAHQRESLRDLFAAGAQRCAAPKIDHDGARPLAVRLQMRAHDFVGGEPAENHRGRRRQGARVGGEEIAAGRQHVAPPACRRPGWARRDAAAVERREQRRAFGVGARRPLRVGRVRERAAENMQAVFDGEVFQVTQPGIDAPERVVRRVRGGDAGLARQRGALRGLDDQLGQPLAPAAIEPVGLRIFVDQALELARIARKPAVDQRRRQMADGHAGQAALGWRGLARIVDDEGIDDGKRPGDDFREAFRRERDRLAGQPFERAVRAHVDDRVDVRRMLQRKPECEERVAGGSAGS